MFVDISFNFFRVNVFQAIRRKDKVVSDFEIIVATVLRRISFVLKSSFDCYAEMCRAVSEPH